MKNKNLGITFIPKLLKISRITLLQVVGLLKNKSIELSVFFFLLVFLQVDIDWFL